MCTGGLGVIWQGPLPAQFSSLAGGQAFYDTTSRNLRREEPSWQRAALISPPF